MKVVLLHGADAAEPPGGSGARPDRGGVARTRSRGRRGCASAATWSAVIAALRGSRAGIVFNLAESFDGKSALESNVAALLNLLGLRYTGSSPAGLLMAGDKSLTKQVLGFQQILTPQFATMYPRRAGSCGRPASSR